MKRFTIRKNTFINPNLSPNLERADVLTSLKAICYPFYLQSGSYITKVESWFKYNFSTQFAYTFASAREAEYALLRAIGVKKDDQVLVQAFTCVAVINPILWLEAKPVYVDIDRETLSMDPSDLKKKITKKTKAIIIQHTFGIPSKIEEIKKIAKEKNIFLIEDSAHVIGGVYKRKKLGQFGDAAFFSFGRDKAISSVFGGIVITNKRRIAEKIKTIKDVVPFPPNAWTYQQLMHPVSTYIAINCFRLNPFLGKLYLYLIKKINLISKPVDTIESTARRAKIEKYPNALAMLSFGQLMKLNSFNKQRAEIFKIYRDELHIKELSMPQNEAFYLRVPALVKKKEELLSFCKNYSVYLGDWYSNVIDPKDTNFDTIFYKKGSCKVAEIVAKEIVNLPCHPSMNREDAKKVVAVIKHFYAKK